ncbi:MAG: hypothetical protein AB7E32_08075 [Desulfovibrio sp.]
MSLYLRSTTVATAGVVLAGAAAYAIYKTGALRPVAVGIVRGSMKVADWVGDKYRTASSNVRSMVEEARESHPCAAQSATDTSDPKKRKATPKPAKSAAKTMAQPSN